MNILHFCLRERRDFGDIMSAEGLSRLPLQVSTHLESALKQAPLSHEILAIWSQDPQDTGQLPDLLVCDDGTEEDWAAWITTFGTKIRPFSAYSRLVTYSGIRKLSRSEQLPRLDRLAWPAAGLVLGEVLAASRLPDKALEAVPAAACASTLSFVLFRAAAAYSNFQDWLQLVSAWESVRQATNQRERAIEGRAVARVCATILEAGGLTDTSSDLGRIDAGLRVACRELIDSPERVPTSLAKDSRFAAIEKQMHGSREDRVVAFAEFVLSAVGMPAKDSEMTSFMLGYLASRIAPGTIRHSSVLAPIVNRYPTATLWYGFCAGLGGTETGLPPRIGTRRVGTDLPPSARRVVRDLLRSVPVIAPPHCDIGALELMSLSRTSKTPLDGLITTTQGTVIVELAPGVWTALNASSKVASSEGPVRTARDKEILTTLGECIDRLRGAYNELAGNDSLWSEGEQRSMFPSKRRRK